MINFNPDHVYMHVHPSPNIFLFFFSFCHPPMPIFLAVWHRHFVAVYCTVCIHHVTAIGISGRANCETFLYHCISFYMVCMLKYEYYVVVSCFLLVITAPQYPPSLVKCLVLLDDCVNYYSSLRKWENTIIWVWRTGWIVVLPMFLVMSCWRPYGHVLTLKSSSMHSEQ